MFASIKVEVWMEIIRSAKTSSSSFENDKIMVKEKLKDISSKIFPYLHRIIRRTGKQEIARWVKSHARDCP